MNVIEDHTSLARSANITPQAHHAPAGRTALFVADGTPGSASPTFPATKKRKTLM